MKAIFTKYHGYTATRGTRISASDGHTRVYVQHNPSAFDGSIESEHERAALELCKRLNWQGTLAHGGLKNGGFVFVFVNPEELLEVR